jgi:hypothetical protein
VCACYTTTAAIVDYCGLDVYPQDGAAGTYFSGVLGLVATEVAGIEAASCASANCEAWANESSFLRYGPTSGGGEGATYYGCGYVEWLQDGLSIAWIQDVTGKWVPANGMKGWSVFAMAPFMYITTDPLNNRCDNSDGYMPLAMQAAGSITQYGLAYGRAAAGQSATVQGTAKIQNGKIQ